MAKFYDAKDDTDLARVEGLLKKGGIEYSVAAAPAKGEGFKQIGVAEEDMAKAEEMLLQTEDKG